MQVAEMRMLPKMCKGDRYSGQLLAAGSGPNKDHDVIVR